jgi:hypothetical protein
MMGVSQIHVHVIYNKGVYTVTLAGIQVCVTYYEELQVWPALVVNKPAHYKIKSA